MGPFTNYVYKRGRWSKISTFCKLIYHRKCKRRGVGGQKKTNFVNVVCERPLSKTFVSVFSFQLKIKRANCPVKKSFRMVFWKLFWPTTRKNCSSGWEKLLKICQITRTTYWNSQRSKQFLKQSTCLFKVLIIRSN